jgi:hypothetical protein
MAYGFVRKVVDLVHAKIIIRDYDQTNREYHDRPIPMLLTDRVVVMGISTLAAPYLLPKYLYDDMSCIELRLRNANPDDYGYGDKGKRSIIDYMF